MKKLQIRVFGLFGMILAVAAAIVLLNPGEVSAAYEYSTTDSQGQTSLTGGGYAIAGHHMAYYDYNSDGKKQIYYQNLETGVTKAITDNAGLKESPRISLDASGNHVIVWTDRRNYDRMELVWDIYVYTLADGKELKLNTVKGQHTAPSTDGRYVTWYDLNDNTMYIYDLQQSKGWSLWKRLEPCCSRRQNRLQTNRRQERPQYARDRDERNAHAAEPALSPICHLVCV